MCWDFDCLTGVALLIPAHSYDGRGGKQGEEEEKEVLDQRWRKRWGLGAPQGSPTPAHPRVYSRMDAGPPAKRLKNNRSGATLMQSDSVLLKPLECENWATAGPGLRQHGPPSGCLQSSQEGSCDDRTERRGE